MGWLRVNSMLAPIADKGSVPRPSDALLWKQSLVHVYNRLKHIKTLIIAVARNECVLVGTRIIIKVHNL